MIPSLYQFIVLTFTEQLLKDIVENQKLAKHILDQLPFKMKIGQNKTEGRDLILNTIVPCRICPRTRAWRPWQWRPWSADSR